MDPTWKSPYCLQCARLALICLPLLHLTYWGNESRSLLLLAWAGATGNVQTKACNDRSHCCGQDNATCCAVGDGIFIVDNKVPLTKASSSSSASSLSSTASSTASSSSSWNASGVKVATGATTPASSFPPSLDGGLAARNSSRSCRYCIGDHRHCPSLHAQETSEY